MKLFEYMATGRPIIACDVPTIREVVDENHVFFCQPDNTAGMVETIQYVVQNWPLALEKADRARSLFLGKFTFEQRARTILNAIGV
jgi:glycosyltransferase involved in cell wall biosynthesis